MDSLPNRLTIIPATIETNQTLQYRIVQPDLSDKSAPALLRPHNSAIAEIYKNWIRNKRQLSSVIRMKQSVARPLAKIVVEIRNW